MYEVGIVSLLTNNVVTWDYLQDNGHTLGYIDFGDADKASLHYRLSGERITDHKWGDTDRHSPKAIETTIYESPCARKHQ